MALVKLTNIGEETFEGVYDGKVFKIDPDKDGQSFVIVEEAVAKHWLGDWSLTDENAKAREKRRIEMLFRPNMKYKIVVTPFKVESRTQEVNPYKPDPVIVNENILVPDQKEFEDLEELAKEVKPKESTPKKTSSKN